MQFRKPYISGLFPGGERRCHYPYPEKMLLQHDIFPLFVLDGGAFFLMNRYFGQGTSMALLQAYKDGTLLKPWTVKGRTCWDLGFQQSCKSKTKNTIEKQAWISRLYFLLPLAQEFFRTKDETWARKWYSLWEKWVSAHPFRKEKCHNFYKTDLVWYDMQVCWRTLIFIHSINLLGGSRHLDREKWRKIYRVVEFHLECLYGEGHEELESGTGRQNHFLQKGAALLYGGILFPEFKKAAPFVETGRGIIEQQMKTEILADGCSIETCPSYSHFIARQYVDAFVLMKKNSVTPIPGLEASIRRQYDWMYQNATPKMLTQQIGDSYAMSVQKDLEIVSELFPFKKSKTRKSIFYPVSKFAILRNSRFDVYVEAGEVSLGHHHLGRPNIQVWVDKELLWIDSGCPDYDMHAWEDWYKSSTAHNVVLVQRQRGCTKASPTNPAMTMLNFTATQNACRCKAAYAASPGFSSYTHERTIRIGKKSLRILDRIESAGNITAKQVFHFGALNICLLDQGTKAHIFFHGKDLVFSQISSKGKSPFNLDYRPAYDQQNKVIDSPQLASIAKGRSLEFEVELTIG